MIYLENYNKILRALNFSSFQHRNQKRKDKNGTPYINHCINVAFLISEIGKINDPDILCAAILHDTIEDTNTIYEEIAKEFGHNVASMVLAVSDDKNIDKNERKLLQIEKAKNMNHKEAAIVIADKISNIRDIIFNPPNGWDKDRKEAYIAWSKSVVGSLPIVNENLLNLFNEIVDDIII